MTLPPPTPPFDYTLASLAATIDHSVLAENATRRQVLDACMEARTWGFASVCVRPAFVGVVAKMLSGSSVKVCTVISFPHGTDSVSDKVTETRQAIADGAQEIDWVFNHRNIITLGVARPMALIETEVRTIADLAQQFSEVTFKVIIETCALTDDQKRSICALLAMNFGKIPLHLKTSTGCGTPRADNIPVGATVEDVRLMFVTARPVHPGVKINASGGIQTIAAAMAMIKAGATRLGMSTAGALDVMHEAVEVRIE